MVLTLTCNCTEIGCIESIDSVNYYATSHKLLWTVFPNRGIKYRPIFQNHHAVQFSTAQRHKRPVTTAYLLSMDTHSTSSRDSTLSGTESPYVPSVPNSRVIPRFTLQSTPDITTHIHAKQGPRPWPTTAITARRSPELLTHYSSVPDPNFSTMTSSSATIRYKNAITNKY